MADVSSYVLLKLGSLEDRPQEVEKIVFFPPTERGCDEFIWGTVWRRIKQKDRI